MTEVTEEFKNQALFDLKMEGKLKDSATYHSEMAASSKESIELLSKDYAEAVSHESSFNLKSEAVTKLKFALDSTNNQEVKAQAEAYLNQLFSSDKSIELGGKKGKDVDLDGSKKSIFGKLKNKVHNFWKPFNPKKRIEEAIGNLQEAMGKDPETFKHLRDMATRNNNGNSSFNSIVTARDDFGGYLHSKTTKTKENLDSTQKYEQQHISKQQEKEAQMEARLEVRDNAAKEIELRSAARESIGIKDINANSGVDKLADRAKAMEGMTPQQRLAFRMKELRGTKKETTQPAVKRELDSNIMSQKLNNQRQ